MITPYLPFPPISGGRNRTYTLIKRLRDEFTFTLACFGRPEEQAFDITPLRDLCEVHVIDRAPSPGKLRAALLSISSISPITTRLYASVSMSNMVSRMLHERQYAAIHVESFYMMQHVPDDCRVPVLLTEPSIEYMAWWRFSAVAQPVYQRPALMLEAAKMRMFEPRAWQRAQLVGAVSQVDLDLVRRVAPNVQVMLTPNGVDEQAFRPGTTPRDPLSAVYMGDYKYFPNTEAILYFTAEIMPLIRDRLPGFTLTLLGKEPPAELVALGENPRNGLRVLGLVPDTRPYLTGAGVFICPQRSGGGTRFKLMEALACGCPVVSTTLGAEGLGGVPGSDLLIADTPRAFADAILTLAGDPMLRERLGINGRQLVIEKHSAARSSQLHAQAYRWLMDEHSTR
jgi:hypothetical protein